MTATKETPVLVDSYTSPRKDSQLFSFAFGAYGSTEVLVFASGVESGLETAADWLAEHEPGHLSTPKDMEEYYAEAAEELEFAWPNDCEVEARIITDHAECDMTYTEAGWLVSHEWFVNEVASDAPAFSEALITALLELEELEIPEWIEDGHITCVEDISSIAHGGCASGSYMPAVTYCDATKTMANHGNQVLQYIEDHYGELPEVPRGESWSGIAVLYLSTAVELWAHSAMSTIDPRNW